MLEYYFTAAVLLSALLLYFWSCNQDTLSVIPGPKPLPFLGNIPELVHKAPHKVVDEWSKKYGNILKMYYFRKPIVVVSGLESIHKVLIQQSADFVGRPCMYRLEVLMDNYSGVIATDEWAVAKARRKLMQTYLRQFGSGMKKIEEITMAAADDLMHKILEQNGHPIRIRDDLYYCVTNVMCVLIRGKTIEEAEVTKVLHMIQEFIEALDRNGQGELLDWLPWLRHFGVSIYKKLLSINDVKRTTVIKWFEDRPENGFISFIQSLSDDQKLDFAIPEERHEIGVMWDFFTAGVFTTANTLSILVNVLSQMPHVQEKLRKEVLEKVGSARAPSIEDREQIPYHRAALFEIGRFASIVPLGVPHKSTTDTYLGQYPIPKGTEIFQNLWGLHHDPELWDEPYVFKPERFLDDQGEVRL